MIFSQRLVEKKSQKDLQIESLLKAKDKEIQEIQIKEQNQQKIHEKQIN